MPPAATSWPAYRQAADNAALLGPKPPQRNSGIDADAPVRAWRETILLAQAHRPTAYDAAYLELAQRTGLELASKDAELCAAAAVLGVKLAL